MKLQTIALLSVLSVATADVYAEDGEIIDCFYESNQSHAACAVDAKAEVKAEVKAERKSATDRTTVVSVDRVYGSDEVVDCFYEVNWPRVACR